MPRGNLDGPGYPAARNRETIGGDLLDDAGRPTGHKLRGMNEANVIARSGVRDQIRHLERNVNWLWIIVGLNTAVILLMELGR